MKPRMTSRSVGRLHSGFTLLELLVVLGIVAVVMGFVLSSLIGARRAANALGCESNLRQWALATRMYSNENNGCLPRRGQGVAVTTQVTRPQDWFNALPPQLRQPAYSDLLAKGRIPRPPGRSVWICPAAVDDQASPYYWSYGMNMGLSVEEASVNNGQPDKITNVGDASVMVLMADAPGQHCSVFPSKFPGGYNPVARHRGKVNIAFLDGHVAAFTAAYLGVGTGLQMHPDVRWHPPGNTWNSAQ